MLRYKWMLEVTAVDPICRVVRDRNAVDVLDTGPDIPLIFADALIAFWLCQALIRVKL